MLPFYQMRPDESFAFTSCDPDFPPHMHIHLEIFYVLEGEFKITVNQRTKVMTKGDLAVVFPNCIHSREKLQSNSPVRVIVAAVKPEMAGDFSNIILNFIPENPFLSSDMIPDEVSDAIFHLLELNNDWRSVYHSTLIRSYIQIILGLEIPCINLMKNTLRYTLIQKSVNYILNNFDQPSLSLESVAEYVGATRNHLSAVFSQKFNIRFNEYLNNVRLNYAHDLLRNTGQSITQIAFSCGFGTLRTFNRVFKKSFHMTPSEFRNLQKTDSNNEPESRS